MSKVSQFGRGSYGSGTRSWPQEMPREVKLANFRDPLWKAKQPKSKIKTRPGMSERHLGLLRRLPCVITGRVPAAEVHHLKSVPGRGVGMKAVDKWALPLSRQPHDEVERIGSRNERAWFLSRGIDPHALATALWNASGNIEQMWDIVIAHCKPSARREALKGRAQ